MKIIIFISLIAVFAISCGGGSQEMLDALDQAQKDLNVDSISNQYTTTVDDTSILVFSSSVRYNDFIINNQTGVINKMVELVNCMDKCDDTELRNKYKEFGDETKYSLKQIKRLSDFGGNTEFRDRAVDLFNFYIDVYENAYKELIEMVIKGDISEKDQARMNKIVEDVGEKEAKLDNAFQAAQQKFADENDMQIIENDIQKEIDNM
jgi:hypothetical protein